MGPVWRDDWSEGDRKVAGTFPVRLTSPARKAFRSTYRQTNKK
ncbi:MAG: hypothetical protein RLY70_3421, partial [Planctomycetota bacterium]